MKSNLTKCEECGSFKEPQSKNCGMCLYRQGKLNIGLSGQEELLAVKINEENNEKEVIL